MKQHYDTEALTVMDALEQGCPGVVDSFEPENSQQMHDYLSGVADIHDSGHVPTISRIERIAAAQAIDCLQQKERITAWAAQVLRSRIGVEPPLGQLELPYTSGPVTPYANIKAIERELSEADQPHIPSLQIVVA